MEKDILAFAKFIPISTEHYLKFIDLMEEENERINQQRVEQVRTDNIGVYRYMLLQRCGFKLSSNGSHVIRHTTTDKITRKLTFKISVINEMTDSDFFALLLELETRQ